MKRQRGFSLIEMLVVVAIIGLIAAIAIPLLRKARQHANAASAVQSLRTIVTAQYLYQRRYTVYGTLAQLAPEGTLNTSLVSGRKSGYAFAITLTPDSKSFGCTATPEDQAAIMPHFFADETAVIRYNDGASADASSSPIPK